MKSLCYLDPIFSSDARKWKTTRNLGASGLCGGPLRFRGPCRRLGVGTDGEGTGYIRVSGKEAIPSITKAVILLSNNSMKAILSQRIWPCCCHAHKIYDYLASKKRELLPRQIVKWYMDSTHRGFQIRNEFFRGNIGRALECKRTHVREMRQICTAWKGLEAPTASSVFAAEGARGRPTGEQSRGKPSGRCFMGAFFEMLLYWNFNQVL